MERLTLRMGELTEGWGLLILDQKGHEMVDTRYETVDIGVKGLILRMRGLTHS